MRKLRRTSDDKVLASVRIFLGVMFLATGLMKFTIPMLAEAWSGQLIQANIPLYGFNVRFVPALEILLGVALITGFYSRVGALLVIPIMLVASYVHAVVDDPSLFPLQPEAPVIPIVVLVLAVFVLSRGGGAWSLDLRSAGSEFGTARER